MIQLIAPELDTYAEEHSYRPPALLRELEEFTHKNCAQPQMVTGALQGALLRMLVKLTNAKRILEIGLFTGYSALTMAEAMGRDGRVVSCEVDHDNAVIARSYFARSPHGNKIEISLGPALDTLRAMRGSFDLVFLDADKENYCAYYDLVLPLLKTGGVIVADNVLWSGKVLRPESETDHAIAAFNNKVANDPAVEVVLLTLRDGVSLIRKN